MNSVQMLSHQFVKVHPTDAVRILERLQIEDTALFLKELPPMLSAGVVKLMDSSTAAQCLSLIGASPSAAIVAKLPMEIASVLLRRMDESKVESILNLLPDELAESLELVLRYPEGTAGALMAPQVFTLPDDITVEEALKRVQNHPEQGIYIYVVNREHFLVGVLGIHQLMFARNEERISSIIPRNVGKLSPNMTYEAILANPGWRESYALPVVDENGIFLGAIEDQTLRRLESDSQQRQLAARGNDAGTALGELYGIGLSALIKGAISTLSRVDTSRRHSGEDS